MLTPGCLRLLLNCSFYALPRLPSAVISELFRPFTEAVSVRVLSFSDVRGCSSSAPSRGFTRRADDLVVELFLIMLSSVGVIGRSAIIETKPSKLPLYPMSSGEVHKDVSLFSASTSSIMLSH